MGLTASDRANSYELSSFTSAINILIKSNFCDRPSELTIGVRLLNFEQFNRMSARDAFHQVVKTALQNEGWNIMEKLENYSKIIQTLLNQYCQLRSSRSEVDTEIIVDTEHHHYQLVQVGWQNNHRVYGCILHLDIKGGKIWLQHNGTERQVADDLVGLGVPKQDIVLGFHSPSKRKFTEFAVG